MFETFGMDCMDQFWRSKKKKKEKEKKKIERVSKHHKHVKIPLYLEKK
jgi:hypothetical protein